MLPVVDEALDETEKPPRPTPTPSPITSTWQDGAEPPETVPSSGQTRSPAGEARGSVTVMICPLTKMRATAKCPEKESKTFARGIEPRDSCTFHK